MGKVLTTESVTGLGNFLNHCRNEILQSSNPCETMSMEAVSTDY